jgi:flagellar assembly protein FliH
LIIKGNRGAPASDEAETRPAPPASVRESAIIKSKGGPPPAVDPTGQRRSTLLKRGTYALTSSDTPAPEAAPPPPPDPDRVAIPTGDRPLTSPPMGDPGMGGAMAQVPVTQVGPPVDQQIIEEAKRRAEAILRQAQLDAKKLLEESKIHCQSALEQAEKDGFELGRQKGYETSQQEMAVLILQVRQMLSETIYAREKVLRACEGQIADLANKVAERVIQTAVTTNPEVIKNQVTQVLEKVKDREHITVRVNPQDLDVVRARREMFHKILEGPKSFEIQADPKVDRGGAMIETNLGNIDARISTQLQAIHIAVSEVEKRMQEEWERAAQEAARQVLEQGLPPELAARVQPPPPPPEMLEAARQHVLQQLMAQQAAMMQQQAALEQAAREIEQEMQSVRHHEGPGYAAEMATDDPAAEAHPGASGPPDPNEAASMRQTMVDGGPLP